ncbi:uncharacterized protein L969DRAFT_91740 [Mixia osmundae IAM 14324]|uniref:Oxysterol-binding protein n=1 Tax=Mixia osmundae (strain CBS 9802 / IAM 14324 / JCM 22182 / KY 12970) TaxID=764103 RepID=G7E0D3_MIXOS|nr:uncharacterized protein L969DRAFT_91740 [Mixia osmundae IAM 14324]KEI42285.1 hypothetical protein L969DRAFT_91740 [Mixia osmundae IAM 14324]GAA96293.1 hypothetical protein E5Q_02959 [Mixia osmundae IAM 14324]
MSGFLGKVTGRDKAGSPAQEGKAPEGANPDDTEVLDEGDKSILMGIISQLRPGVDLSRITLPVFVLEPRSMLERVTDFLSSPDLIFGTGSNPDSKERFIQVLRYFLAGWHIKPKGVKKPYNPILGEFFRCRYDYNDGTVGYYIAEQVSHHPPISAYYFVSPENSLVIYGELRPKSKFLGNSAATIMEGTSKVKFLDKPEDGEYIISMPNMYARGILWGKMVLEIGDVSHVENAANDMTCDIEFKSKPFFGGTYNSLHGHAKEGKKSEFAEISGKWSEVMEIKRDGEKKVLFDAGKADVTPKSVSDEADQLDHESRKLWSKVTAAIKKNDLDAATDAKTAIEDAQRDRAKDRDHKSETHEPKYFVLKGDEWAPKFDLPSDPKEASKAVAEWIYGSDKQPPSRAS